MKFISIHAREKKKGKNGNISTIQRTIVRVDRYGFRLLLFNFLLAVLVLYTLFALTLLNLLASYRIAYFSCQVKKISERMCFLLGNNLLVDKGAGKEF